MGLGKYILKRLTNGLIAYILILIVISAVLNTHLDIQARTLIKEQLSQIMRDNWIELMTYSDEELTQYRQDMLYRLGQPYDLEKPLVVRIFTRALKTITFDLGETERMRTRSPIAETSKFSKVVKDLIFEAFPATFILLVSTTIISIFVSIFVGVLKARYFNGLFDRVTTFLTMVFYGVPTWLFGWIMVWIFSVELNWLPFGRLNSVPPPEGVFAMFLDRAHHLALPVIAVLLVRFWPNALLIKSVVLDIFQQEYITALRGRGLPERRVMRHVIQSASPAIITIAASSIVGAAAGDIALEYVISWPGIGLLLWNAIHNLEISLMMGILALLTLTQLIAMIVLDVAYAFLDPRIKYT